MWHVLVRPSSSAFDDALAEVNFGRAIIATLGIGVVVGFIGGIINVLAVGDSIIEAITLTIITPFRLLFALVVVNAFWLAILRALGGSGDFATQTSISALVFVPTHALSNVFLAIPSIGGAFALIVLAYGVVVSVFALRAAHGGLAWRVSNIVLLVIALIGGLLGVLAMSSIPQ